MPDPRDIRPVRLLLAFTWRDVLPSDLMGQKTDLSSLFCVIGEISNVTKRQVRPRYFLPKGLRNREELPMMGMYNKGSANMFFRNWHHL